MVLWYVVEAYVGNAQEVDVEEFQAAEQRARVTARLKALRADGQLNITGLSSQTGLSETTIRGVLAGNKRYHPKTISVLARAVDPKDPTFVKPELSQEDLEIAIAYHHASTPLRNFVAQLLKTREFATPAASTPSSEALTIAYKFDRINDHQREAILVLIDHFLQFPGKPASNGPTTNPR